MTHATSAATTFARTPTGIPPLDRVLGGGIVAGSVVLLAGRACLGKTTLSLQAMACPGLGNPGARGDGGCLYATSEETRESVEDRAQRLGVLTPCLFVRDERDLSKIFARAREARARALVVDSIHRTTCAEVNGRSGSPAQVKACAERLVQLARTNGTTIWIVGHCTSNDDVAGSRTLEHVVDVVLKLSHVNGDERLLRCSKNRFGPTDVVGRLKLTAAGFVGA